MRGLGKGSQREEGWKRGEGERKKRKGEKGAEAWSGRDCKVLENQQLMDKILLMVGLSLSYISIMVLCVSRDFYYITSCYLSRFCFHYLKLNISYTYMLWPLSWCPLIYLFCCLCVFDENGVFFLLCWTVHSRHFITEGQFFFTDWHIHSRGLVILLFVLICPESHQEQILSVHMEVHFGDHTVSKLGWVIVWVCNVAKKRVEIGMLG